MKAIGGASKKPNSEDHTHSDIKVEDTILHKEDTVNTFEVLPHNSNLIATIVTPIVSTPPASSVPIQLESYVFQNIINEPVIDLSQTPPPPPVKSIYVLIETSIPPLPKFIF